MSLGYNDAILLISLLYSGIDIGCEWELFTQCRRPIHYWLFVSFAMVIVFRMTHVLGMHTTSMGAGDFLLDLRQKDKLPRTLARFIWLVALPFFVFWTFLGTCWLWEVLRETPGCVPTTTHLWFSIFWLALCYIWIIIHAALGVVAWLLERRVRRAEVDLRQIEDADVISRWGQVSQLQGYQSLSGAATAGLNPKEISCLPCFTMADSTDEDDNKERECPICLNECQSGESLRKLDVCGHTFHKSCIDLWLIRCSDCPLCKRNVRTRSAPAVEEWHI